MSLPTTTCGNIDAEALAILKRLAGAREKRRVLLAYMQANQYKKGDPSPESRILDEGSFVTLTRLAELSQSAN